MIVNLFPCGGEVYKLKLQDATPAQIQQAVRDGIAENLWAVGDITAPITIAAFGNYTGGLVRAFILGFNHNSSIEGNGITFSVGKDASDDKDIAIYSLNYFYMTDGNYNEGGWESCRMRNTVCTAFYSAMPSDWQNIISSTIKYTDNVGGSNNPASSVTSTTDKIFLLAEYEVFGTRTYANSNEKTYQKQYDYYKNGASIERYRHDAITSKTDWWSRSVGATGYRTSWCLFSAMGIANYTTGDDSRGFSPAFRVA